MVRVHKDFEGGKRVWAATQLFVHDCPVHDRVPPTLGKSLTPELRAKAEWNRHSPCNYLLRMPGVEGYEDILLQPLEAFWGENQGGHWVHSHELRPAALQGVVPNGFPKVPTFAERKNV